MKVKTLIVEVPLSPYYDDFAYIKIFCNWEKIVGRKPFFQYLVYIYDYLLAKQAPLPANEYPKLPLLVAPLEIFNAQEKAIKTLGWRILSSEISALSPKDIFLPDVKVSSPPVTNVYHDYKGEEGNQKLYKWFYRKEMNAAQGYSYQTNWANVAHLDFSNAIALSLLPLRISIELYKKKGQNILEVIKVPTDSELRTYNLFAHQPIYTSLPEEMQGRALK